MKLSNLSGAIGATAALFALTLGAQAQTTGCAVGVANGGAFPTVGTGGGGTYPTTFPTSPTSFTLNVATLPPGASVVTEVKLFGLSHTFVGDLQMVLTDPSGAMHNVFVRASTTAGGPFPCDYSGDYVFVPACTNGASLPLPPTCTGTGVFLAAGTYDQQFGQGTLAWPNGTNGIFNTPLSSIPAAVGTWTLTIYDWATIDTGNLASFDVCFGVAPLPTAPASAPVLTGPASGSSFFNSGAVNLMWNAVACATSYQVDVDGVVFPAVSNSFAYTSAPGPHTWTVRAVNAAGASAFATPFTFTDLGAPPAALSPALIVGNDQAGTASIYAIDPSNGAAIEIFSTTVTALKPYGMAYDPATNTLYWNNASTLNSAPYTNPLLPTTLGPITVAGVNTTFVSLSFANGKLYGVKNTATEGVYEIDPVTRVATLVYAYPTQFDFGGLEHDSATGLIYGLTDTATAPNVRGLYRLDTLAQTSTFLAPYPAGETDIDGLAVNNGLAYYVSDGPNTAQANFYVFDVNTGLQVGTLPSPFTGTGTFSAATFVADNGPVTYCTAGTTTNGCNATISGNVNPNVANNAGVVLSVASIEGQKQGLIFYGIDNSSFVPLPWSATSSSFLCVKSPTQRTGPQSSGGTINGCDGAFTLNWDAFVSANPTAIGVPFTAGQSIFAQAWFRDPPASKTTNLSDALEMTVQP